MTPGPAPAPGAIEHVVVLMLENRSFDHMLGLLDHPSPDYPRIRAGSDEYANPVDPSHGHSDEIRVSADGAFALAIEPPHSHASVMEQLDVRFGRPRMDGFVAAYRRRVLDPGRDRAVVHWVRLGVLGVALVLLGAAAAAWCSQRSFPLTWLGLWVLAGAALGGAWRKRSVLPALDWGGLTAAVLAGSFALAALAAAVAEQSDGWWAFGTLVVVLLGAGAAAVVLGRKHALAPPPPPAGPDPGAPIMHCMQPDERLPALAALARHFAVCTRWHCSVPGATWPNRNFAHAGTSDGTVDIEIGFYLDDTIFDRLEERGKTWHVYHDGIAQLIAFRRLWDDDRIANWYCFDDFARHVANDALPNYSFIEPCHTGPRSNSQHPGNNDFDSGPGAPGAITDFQRGDALVASIYETLRARPDVFAKTVFLVTYDEHGGLYDHVAPPRARSPQPLGRRDRRSVWVWFVSLFVEQPSSRFRFHRYGPRVPAVVVSPRVPAVVDHTLYDHTSIPATVRAWFVPGARPLSRREARAATFAHLVTDHVRDDLPDLGAARAAAAVASPAPVTAAPSSLATPPLTARDDDFAGQLDVLAQHVDRTLDGHGSTVAPAPAETLAPVPAATRADRAAARFVRQAEARRAARGA